MVNPIIDWEEEDVWEFLNTNNIPHCSLYDEGFKRLGCICCPLSGAKNMIRDLQRWPKYKDMYIRAFDKMIANHPGEIKMYRRQDYLTKPDEDLIAITGDMGGATSVLNGFSSSLQAAKKHGTKSPTTSAEKEETQHER